MTSGWWFAMNYWLVKSEPSTWSWDQQVAKGAKGEAWTGVRNFTARQNLVKMKKGRPRLFLSFQRGQGDRRHRRNHQGGLSRSDRQDRKIRLRRHQGRQAAEDAGDHGRDQGRQETGRDGAGEIFAIIRAAGDGGRMEDGLQDGRDVIPSRRSRRSAAWPRPICHKSRPASVRGRLRRSRKSRPRCASISTTSPESTGLKSRSSAHDSTHLHQKDC